MSTASDLDVLKTVASVAAPAGLAIGVFLLVMREVIAKNIFPKLEKDQAYRVIISLAFMAWSIAIAGIVAWFYHPPEPPAPVTPPPPAATASVAPEPDPVALTQQQKDLIKAVNIVAKYAIDEAARAREAEEKGRDAAAIARLGNNPDYKVVDCRDPQDKLEDGRCRYEGEVDGDRITGYGVMTWSGGSKSAGESFSGQYIDKVRQCGVFSYPPSKSNSGNVKRYEGDWEKTASHPHGGGTGYAVVHIRNGSQYIGQLQDETRQGLAKYVTSTGDTCYSHWDKGLPVENGQVCMSKAGKVIVCDTNICSNN